MDYEDDVFQNMHKGMKIDLQVDFFSCLISVYRSLLTLHPLIWMQPVALPSTTTENSQVD